MGWLFAYDQAHRSDLIKERVERKEWTNTDGSKVESIALKHCYKGGMRSGVLYIVWEQTITPKEGTPASKRFIEVDLLAFRKDKQLGSSWGYKDMDCCMGPCNLSCPISYLDLCTPHEGEWCKAWHAKVRALAAAKKANRERVKTLKLGDTVQLNAGCNVTRLRITSLKPLMGEYNYGRYKIKASLIDWAATEKLVTV
jgi:hypothetical protein